MMDTMTSTITRKCATFAASVALVLSAAACSSETDGKGSPASDASSSADSGSSESGDSSSSESESDSSQSEPSGDMLTNYDDTFEVAIPEGYIDAYGQVTTPNHTLAVAENNASSSFPTTIIVESTSAGGAGLDEVAEAVKKNGEGAAGTTASETSPPFDDVDGEDYVAYQYGPYDQDGEQLSSVQIITVHDDTAYAITVNTLDNAVENAGTALISLIESWSWL